MTDDGSIQPEGDLSALASALGTTIVDRRVVAWGDAAATQHLGLADGREIAARRIIGPRARIIAEAQAATMRRAAEAGLPVPQATVVAGERFAWLCTPWIAGESGATWLDRPPRAVQLAGRMGAVARQLRALHTQGLAFDNGSEPEAGRSASESDRLGSVADRLSPRALRAVEQAIGLLPAVEMATDVFVHGDFVPINVLVSADGEIAAVLDFEDASLGSPLADIAWWGYVVRHHHPEAWHATWRTFCAAAETDPDKDEEVLRSLVLDRLLERAAAARHRDTQTRWIKGLEEAAAW